MQLSDYEAKSIQKLGEAIHDGRCSNEGLVELIKLSGEYLNLMSVVDYAEKNGLSYPGARKNTATRQNIEIFNVKFIIDNH